MPIVLGFLPLVPGALIYTAFRPETLIVVGWLESAGLGEVYALIREALQPLRGSLPTWAVYNLPNGLWSFAVFAVIASIWSLRSVGGAAYLVLGLACTIGLELLQYVDLMPGTFDPGDLLSMATLGASGVLAGVAARWWVIAPQERQCFEKEEVS